MDIGDLENHNFLGIPLTQERINNFIAEIKEFDSILKEYHDMIPIEDLKYIADNFEDHYKNIEFDLILSNLYKKFIDSYIIPYIVKSDNNLPILFDISLFDLVELNNYTDIIMTLSHEIMKSFKFTNVINYVIGCVPIQYLQKINNLENEEMNNKIYQRIFNLLSFIIKKNVKYFFKAFSLSFQSYLNLQFGIRIIINFHI